MNIVHSIACQVGTASLITHLYSELTRRYKGNSNLRQFFLAVIFGLGVVLTMLDPLEVGPGIQIDGRQIFIGLASFLLGAVGAGVTLAFGAAIRLHSGGAGAAPGIVGMILVSVAAILWRLRLGTSRSSLRFTEIFILGVLVNISMLSLLMLPVQFAIDVIKAGGLIIFASNMFGFLLIGSLLMREDTRIHSEATERAASRTDELTGLLNRRGFDERVICTRFMEAENVTLLILDVDDFKSINDTFGHARGDMVLCTIGKIIKSHIRAQDVAARLGGDEFVIALKNASPTVGRDVGERICSSIKQYFILGCDMNLSVSIGIATLRTKNIGADTLLNAADAAMYQAKRRGGGRVHTHNRPEPGPVSSVENSFIYVI